MSYKMYIPRLFYYVMRTLNTNSMPNAYIQKNSITQFYRECHIFSLVGADIYLTIMW